LGPEGERAFWAYEHINSYYEGCLVQYERIYLQWQQSSVIPSECEGSMDAKRKMMHQVIRDIHFLLVSKQAIWRSLQTLCLSHVYPSFVGVDSTRTKWASYFEQFREPRNSFEHFEDQVLGKDTRKNSPGFGVKLNPDGIFSLGSQTPVAIGAASKEQLENFYSEFEEFILQVLKKRANPSFQLAYH
jgi:hypothetical protein